MFNKNLKYFRLKKQLTKRKLAEEINVTPMAITNYESGKRTPTDMSIIKKIAEVLDVRILDLLKVRDDELVFRHGEFRKNTALTETNQEFLRESVEEYFSRFMSIVGILGGEVLPDAPKINALKLTGNSEIDAKALRLHLNLAPLGPIKNLLEVLENQGILVYVCDIDNDHFFGMNGTVNNRPYIIVKKKMTPERSRSTIVHELAHLMFRWPSDYSDKEIENIATSISGAFLFPKEDALRELGIKRTSIFTKDAYLVAIEYGISMYMLVKRARLLEIINSNIEKYFYVKASQRGWKKNEPSRIPVEQPKLFEQLVYRAINENVISIQKGAELLKVSYDEVAELSII